MWSDVPLMKQLHHSSSKESEVWEAFRKSRLTHTHTLPRGVLSISVQEIVSSTSFQIWICESVISSATGINGFSIQWYWLKQLLPLGLALIIYSRKVCLFMVCFGSSPHWHLKEPSVSSVRVRVFLMPSFLTLCLKSILIYKITAQNKQTNNTCRNDL